MPKRASATGHLREVQLVAGSRNSGRKHVITLFVDPAHGRLTLGATSVKLLVHAESEAEQPRETAEAPPTDAKS